MIAQIYSLGLSIWRLNQRTFVAPPSGSTIVTRGGDDIVTRGADNIVTR